MVSPVLDEAQKIGIDTEARYECIKEILKDEHQVYLTDLSDSDIACFVRSSIFETYLIDTCLSPEDQLKVKQRHKETKNYGISLAAEAKQMYVQSRIARNRSRVLEYVKAIIGSEKRPQPQEAVRNYFTSKRETV